MAMGRYKPQQRDLMMTWADLPRSPGHAFYDKLQVILIKGGFDAFAEETCQPFYAAKKGAPSIPPGRYFRMHLIGYFEGIDSERGIEWRCCDSLSLRDFLQLGAGERVPDHSSLSKTRSRLSLEAHEQVFTWALKLITEKGLVKGKRIGVDGSTMEANAALRSIVRREDGKTYRETLEAMARESGIEMPSTEDLLRLDKNRKGKKLSNAEWTSPVDPDAKIARMKNGSTHMAYKPEHAVDLDTGAIVAAEIHTAEKGDTSTLGETLKTAEENLAAAGKAPSPENPSECIADKGYHSRGVLKELDDSQWKTRIAEPDRTSFSRWHGDEEARQAVYANRNRLRSCIGKAAMRRRGEFVERSFAHTLERGGMRRTWLRGRANVQKRYLIHVCGFNLGLLMRALTGAGTPKEAAARGIAAIFVIHAAKFAAVIVVTASPADTGGDSGWLAITRRPSLTDAEIPVRQRAVKYKGE